ncbi:MAG: phenylacetate--CoA ligase [Actinobacteria bacterium]|nr:phenylacetate--CoA ligase [Actinomycetota bacterium]MCL6095142.1 phenylacetate--CoA ligase [Actinomycetota bacterium]
MVETRSGLTSVSGLTSIEAAPARGIEQSELDAGVRWSVAHAVNGSPWWRAHFAAAGVDPASITGVADLVHLPFTTKQDLRNSYPLGWASVPEEYLVRIHASSGTTGKRTVCAYTVRDIADWADQFARCFTTAGVTSKDRVQVMVGYGLWTAGAGFQAGAERVGALVIPAGPGNLDLQLELIMDFGTTTICATSSFALLLAETVEARGLTGSLPISKGIFGSERWGERMRERIESLLGIETFDIYGLTELYGPGVGIECTEHDGIHYWSDYYYIEIVDPVSGVPLPPGEEGEVVVTTLRKEGMPLIRYRTRDLSRLCTTECKCGSPFPRLARLSGRTDDMVKVRGVAVFPSQVESIIDRVEGVGPEYQLHLHWDPERGDVMVVRIEANEMPGLREKLIHELHEGLSLHPEVELLPYGSLPRTERKAKRVFDHRS